MYNETIKAENKIITNEALNEIFTAMNECLKKYKGIYEQEKRLNENKEYKDYKYTFKDYDSRLTVRIDFYDNTDIKFDNFDNFMSIYYSRLNEIKSIDLSFVLNYIVMEPEPYRKNDSYLQSIRMDINENKMDISLNLSSEDPKLDDIYRLIKETILNAPTKYDDTIKNKNKITNTIALAIGMIPGIILASILLFIPNINIYIFKGFIIYPLIALIMGYVVGSVMASGKIGKYYGAIMPEKVYDHYDASNGKSVYKDDIEKYVNTSEILIGKKIDNLNNRKMIQKEYETYKSFLPKGLLALLISSIIVILIGLFI